MQAALRMGLAPPAIADEALMARVAAGDQIAFGVLAERHLGRIHRLAYRLLGSAADAEETTQDALLRIWRHAGRWDGERSSLATWIYTITYRLCLDRLRHHRLLPLDEAAEIADPSPDSFEVLARQQEQHALDAALNALPTRQRAALVLFYYEEQSGAEAAAVLGLSMRAFWSLLHRARLAVQQALPSA